jgi:hypothetical protein
MWYSRSQTLGIGDLDSNHLNLIVFKIHPVVADSGQALRCGQGRFVSPAAIASERCPDVLNCCGHSKCFRKKNVQRIENVELKVFAFQQEIA